MTPCPSPEQLARLLSDQLPDAERNALESHIAQCPRCQHALGADAEEPSRWRRLLESSELGNLARDEQTKLTGNGGARELEPRDEFIGRLRRLGAKAEASSAKTALLPAPPGSGTDGGGVAGPPAWPPSPAGSAGGEGHGQTWPTVAGYEILKELGRGGMSVVYLARHVSLERLTALKMILDADPEYRKRLYAEAQAVARLDHPNIVHIYDIGEHQGLPFLALEYVKGGSLHDRINKSPQPIRAAAELVETCARAMHYAHQQGIIHRDLKPANILLQQQVTKETTSAVGSFIPKVTDFGVAKLLGADGATRTGMLVGTPSYMAPEQAGGAREVGPRTDVYALGAILYELLTGRPPFLAADPLDTLLQVRFQEPVPPTALQPKVPRDLDTICLKCLQKESTKRYATANDLADDLRRFLNGEPIHARPPGPLKRVAHWVRRHPLATGSLAALLLAIATGLAGLSYGYVAARAAFSTEAAKRKESEEALYFIRIYLIEKLWQGNDIEQARVLLEECMPRAGETDLRGWEWSFLKRLCNTESLKAENQKAGVPGADESAAWRRLNEHADRRGIDNMAFSPDSRELLLVPHGSQEVQRLDLRTGRELGRTTVPLGKSRGGYCLASSGRVLAASSMENCRVAKVWDIAAPGTSSVAVARELGTFQGHDAPITSMSLTADGSRLATTAWEDTTPARSAEIKIWDVATGRALFSISADSPSTVPLAFSPQGRYFSCCGREGTVRVWDADVGKQVLACMAHSGGVGCSAFSPDGAHLATGGVEDGTVCVWDPASGQMQNQLRGHKHGLTWLAFSPDGKRLASLDNAGEVRLWDPVTGQQALILGEQGAKSPPQAWSYGQVMFSPDGRCIASSHLDGSISVWDAGE
jgi:serine/threonine protein kinase/WD40 repeat protein